MKNFFSKLLNSPLSTFCNSDFQNLQSDFQNRKKQFQNLQKVSKFTKFAIRGLKTLFI